MQIKEHKLKIKEIIDVGPDVKLFRCEIPDGVNVDFYPGQFFMVSIPGEENLKRAYSIASSPHEKHIEICLGKVGNFSSKLFGKNPGDVLIFKGPYGKFFFDGEMKNDLVLFAGGLGITPMMSIIRYCNGKKLNNKVRLLYCAKTPQNLIYKEELERTRDENKNFDFVLTITRLRPEHKWCGKTGRIDEKLLKESIKNIEDKLFYLCGPKEFVKCIIEMLEKLNVKKERIKTDVWG